MKSSNTRSVVSFYIARRSEPYDLHAVPVSSLSPHKVDAFAEGLAAQLPTGVDDVLALSDDGEESSVRIVRDDGRRHLASMDVQGRFVWSVRQEVKQGLLEEKRNDFSQQTLKGAPVVIAEKEIS